MNKIINKKIFKINKIIKIIYKNNRFFPLYNNNKINKNNKILYNNNNLKISSIKKTLKT